MPSKVTHKLSMMRQISIQTDQEKHSFPAQFFCCSLAAKVFAGELVAVMVGGETIIEILPDNSANCTASVNSYIT